MASTRRRATEGLLALLLSLACPSCGRDGDAGYIAEARCALDRPPGGMVATVAEVTVEVRASAEVTSSPVQVELLDGDRVVDRLTFDAGALQAGATVHRTVRFPNAPGDGWTVQPDAVCSASPAVQG